MHAASSVVPVETHLSRQTPPPNELSASGCFSCLASHSNTCSS